MAQFMKRILTRLSFLKGRFVLFSMQSYLCSVMRVNQKNRVTRYISFGQHSLCHYLYLRNAQERLQTHRGATTGVSFHMKLK